MIDWANYKQLLREATLTAIQTRMSEVSDGSRVATIFYFISDHYYNGNLIVLINVMTNSDKNTVVQGYLKGIPDKPKSSEELERYIKNTQVEEIHKDMADGGDNITHDFEFPFDFASMEEDEAACSEMFACQIRTTIEVQRELATDPALMTDEICDGCELTYMAFEGDISLAGVVVKG